MHSPEPSPSPPLPPQLPPQMTPQRLQQHEATLAPQQAAQAWCRLGLEQRRRGEPEAAGRAFLRALELQGDCELALRALDFQAISDAQVAELLPRLEPLLRQGWIQQPRGRLLHADWQHRCGDHQARAQARRLYAALRGEPAGTAEASDASPLDPAEHCPDALLIGAPKCGTTSLMAYLGAHPALWSQPRKELHFFNNRWHWGLDWYAEQFPARSEAGPLLRLEGTPDYLQHPLVPERVRDTLPGVKLIVLLREPLARALSWLEHQRRWAGLQGSSEALLEQEAAELEALSAEQRAQLGWRAPNALAGSLYDDQLQRWLAVVPRRDLLLLRFEDLCLDPLMLTRRVLEFLELDPRQLPAGTLFPQLNRAPQAYPALPHARAQRLRHTLLRGAHRLWSGL